MLFLLRSHRERETSAFSNVGGEAVSRRVSGITSLALREL
jgi:hypothetical protein